MKKQDFLATDWRNVARIARQRLGQAAMNCLQVHNPLLALKVIDNDVDPYYDDTMFDKFMAFVEEKWDECSLKADRYTERNAE